MPRGVARECKIYDGIVCVLCVRGPAFIICEWRALCVKIVAQVITVIAISCGVRPQRFALAAMQLDAPASLVMPIYIYIYFVIKPNAKHKC